MLQSRYCRFPIITVNLLVMLIFGVSCKKLVEIDPPAVDIVASEIFKSNTTAASVVTGIYADMSKGYFFTGRNSISASLGLSADELVSIADPSDILEEYYKNSLTKHDGGLWTNFYHFIFRINAAIEGIESSKGISSNVKDQLLAECKFLRAFMYFHLVNLFGDVPLLLTTDVKITSVAPRTSIVQVYDAIKNDLLYAQEKLNMSYLSGDIQSVSNERVRPNKMAATALLARVYLFTKDYDKADSEASKVLNNADYSLEQLDNVFLKDSKEAIWQLQPVLAFVNTLDAQVFVLAGNGNTLAGPDPSSRPMFLSEDIVAAFQPMDLRRQKWIDSVIVGGSNYPYVFKYKIWQNASSVSEYLMVIRLAEIYLIRAEARAKMGLITGPNSALSDINQIRNRAGLIDILPISQDDLLREIYHQRRLELFTEWGHRWFDLKRTLQINEVMNNVATKKGSTWSPYKALFPIPISDIQRNPSLKGHQNPGYPEQ